MPMVTYLASGVGQSADGIEIPIIDIPGRVYRFRLGDPPMELSEQEIQMLELDRRGGFYVQRDTGQKLDDGEPLGRRVKQRPSKAEKE